MAHLCVRAGEASTEIRGNAEGLLYLAHRLIGLAKMTMTPEHDGYHVHIDAEDACHAEAVDLLLRREDP